MERLTREDWKNPESMMWKKVDDLECSERVKKSIKDVLEKLAKYEDLEEQGKMQKLPVAVGQSVWKIKNEKIQEWVVSTIRLEESGVSFCNAVYICDISDLGKTAFLTREEAESALMELKE